VHKLKIVLEVAAKGVQSGFKAAGSAVKSFLSSLASMASSGRRFIDSLAQSVFFLGNAFGMVKDIAGRLFDRFIGGAGDAAKLEVKIKNIVGSSSDAARVMGYLDQVAQQTGADFEELASGAGLMAVAAKDASGAFDFDKFTHLSDMLQRMAALRPDVPLDRLARGLSTATTTGNWSSLEMFLDVNLRQLVDIADAADEVAGAPGEIGKAATYIETGVASAASEATKSIDLLDEALTRAGATAGIVKEVAELSGMERFNETLQSIARTVGEPLFEALNEGMAELSDWLQDNPELIEELATALGNLGAAGIEKVFAAITNMLASTDWEAFFANATEFFDKLASGDIEGAFEAIQLGDLGADIGEAAATLGDVVVALGKIADFLVTITGGAPGVVADIGMAKGMAEEKASAQAEQVKAWGAPDWVVGLVDKLSVLQQLTPGTGQAQLMTDMVLAKLEEQKVQVEINLNNEMLDARVRQGADDAVVRGYEEQVKHFGGR